jgi:Predicted Zn-dependent protease (DUF2268)
MPSTRFRQPIASRSSRLWKRHYPWCSRDCPWSAWISSWATVTPPGQSLPGASAGMRMARDGSALRLILIIRDLAMLSAVRDWLPSSPTRCTTWRARGPGFGETLGEVLVTEGLAQCFEVEIGCPAPPYAIAVADDALKQFAARARNEVETKEYDSRAWFYGRSGDPHFPRHGGYSLGYALTKSWLAAEGMTASAAAGVPASRLIQAWLSDRIGI